MKQAIQELRTAIERGKWRDAHNRLVRNLWQMIPRDDPRYAQMHTVSMNVQDCLNARSGCSFIGEYKAECLSILDSMQKEAVA